MNLFSMLASIPSKSILFLQVEYNLLPTFLEANSRTWQSLQHCVDFYQSGETALIKAILEGHLSIVKHLLRAGANPDARDDVSFTSFFLHRAYARNDFIVYF
jgi:hypothetical protein